MTCRRVIASTIGAASPATCAFPLFESIRKFLRSCVSIHLSALPCLYCNPPNFRVVGTRTVIPQTGGYCSLSNFLNLINLHRAHCGGFWSLCHSYVPYRGSNALFVTVSDLFGVLNRQSDEPDPKLSEIYADQSPRPPTISSELLGFRTQGITVRGTGRRARGFGSCRSGALARFRASRRRSARA